ncbi:hypothetical protein IMG5_098600 [Ichthyophthirius multifiliis]|uniref:Transmembrane protein n=1 Tax=Ichthyophthirius multifiliis TaxID=5932 RepID=G0QRZ4_ICHMU|nr:hypothetical protein IMG5_098600 [Ichthyophthirius multifiliis]EGR32024.1 hypothetical protein IMG5_098600 [Ichthyophthirius multifiliis]|eukprot:XP_004035510.1 hypothetical protein IMG5_098600 [Ichthyophthirius multifiliis]
MIQNIQQIIRIYQKYRNKLLLNINNFFYLLFNLLYNILNIKPKFQIELINFEFQGILFNKLYKIKYQVNNIILIQNLNKMSIIKQICVFFFILICIIYSEQTTCHNNCKYCLGDKIDQCVQCQHGFFSLNNVNNQYLKQCFQCHIDYCQQCDQFGNCFKCQESYFLSSNLCYKCQIQNCLQCQNKQKCLKCQEGYTLFQDNSTCKSIEIYCQIGYYLNNQSICQVCTQNCQYCNSQYQCFQCSNKYYFDTFELKCLKCQVNCIQCKPNENYCLECEKEYTLINGKCIKIQTQECQLGEFFDKKQGKCQICSQNCLICDSQTNCLECFDEVSFQIILKKQKNDNCNFLFIQKINFIFILINKQKKLKMVYIKIIDVIIFQKLGKLIYRQFKQKQQFYFKINS